MKNKKVNTLIFVLAGTLFDVVVALALILLLLFGISKLAPLTGEWIYNLAPVAMIGGLVLAMFFYQKLSKWVIAKFNLEDQLEPLFNLGRKSKRTPLD
jgi:hypothetical protein